MGRYRWLPNWLDEYRKMRNRIDREYGERAYNDRFRIESSPGMLRQEEPDYDLHIKPYRPEKKEFKTFPLEANENADLEKSGEKLEAKSIENKSLESEPRKFVIHDLEYVKDWLDLENDGVETKHDSQLEVQNNRYEKELAVIEKEILSKPAENNGIERKLEVEKQSDFDVDIDEQYPPDEFISDEDIIKKEKLRKLGHGHCGEGDRDDN